MIYIKLVIPILAVMYYQTDLNSMEFPPLRSHTFTYRHPDTAMRLLVFGTLRPYCLPCHQDRDTMEFDGFDYLLLRLVTSDDLGWDNKIFEGFVRLKRSSKIYVEIAMTEPDFYIHACFFKFLLLREGENNFYGRFKQRLIPYGMTFASAFHAETYKDVICEAFNLNIKF